MFMFHYRQTDLRPPLDYVPQCNFKKFETKTNGASDSHDKNFFLLSSYFLLYLVAVVVVVS